MEVVTYRSPEEGIEKALYLLDREEGRRAIAAAGQRRTLRDHAYAGRRAARPDEVIRNTHASRANATQLHAPRV